MNDLTVAPAETTAAPTTPRTWVSVDPHDKNDTRTTASAWDMFINQRTHGERICLWSCVIETPGKGWAALADLDDVLWDQGYMRSQDWQIGTGRGYVVWIAPMSDTPEVTR